MRRYNEDVVKSQEYLTNILKIFLFDILLENVCVQFTVLALITAALQKFKDKNCWEVSLLPRGVTRSFFYEVHVFFVETHIKLNKARNKVFCNRVTSTSKRSIDSLHWLSEYQPFSLYKLPKLLSSKLIYFQMFIAINSTIWLKIKYLDF